MDVSIDALGMLGLSQDKLQGFNGTITGNDLKNFGWNNNNNTNQATNAATSLGMNIGTGQLALGGLGALGSLWTAWNASDLAKKQFDFTKKMSTANYYNQMQSYNTNLEDKAYARYAMENKSPSEAAAYISGHQLRPML